MVEFKLNSMAMIKIVFTFSLAFLMQHGCLASGKNEVIRVTLDGQTYQVVISPSGSITTSLENDGRSMSPKPTASPSEIAAQLQRIQTACMAVSQMLARCEADHGSALSDDLFTSC